MSAQCFIEFIKQVGEQNKMSNISSLFRNAFKIFNNT